MENVEMEETKYAHIQLAINFADLIRTTLGPRGMNKMVVTKSGAVHTNDGATIIKNIISDNPIIQLFKELAKSQEEAIGDGTTTAVIITGQLLNNALDLLNKGLHPTTIINGFSLAKVEAMRILNNLKKKGDKEKIINTTFGSKIANDLVKHLRSQILRIKNYEELKIHKIPNSDPLNSHLFKGYVFEGFTLNDRMERTINGKIAVLDYRTNVEAANVQVNSAKSLEEMNLYDRKYKREIVDKLVKQKVNCLFYTDTNPEFETYLTEKGITGIVLYKREILDGICEALDLKATSNIDNIFITEGKVEYKKPNQIYVYGNSETLILHGSTIQTLDEIERAVQDVVSLFKHEIDTVTGAGAVEIQLSKKIAHFAKTVGGKEQIAIEKYAEAIESIPLIIAENCGLDAIQILTVLKTQHETNPDMGVDAVRGISDASQRGIVDPVLVKIYAINSATNVANLILKTDKLLAGEEK
jgi:chaperonin GroEL (HSP60 family)